MPEIDLTIEKNRNAFIDWRHEKFQSGEAILQGEGDLNTEEYIYADLINGEPVNTFTYPEIHSVLPEAFIRAEVSDNHAKELKDAGVVFNSKPTIKDVLGKAIEQTEQDIKRIQTEGRPSDLIY